MDNQRTKSSIVNGWDKKISALQKNMQKFKRELNHIPQSTFNDIPGHYVAMPDGVRWWLPYTPESAKLLDERLKKIGFEEVRRSDSDGMYFTWVTYRKYDKRSPAKTLSRIEIMYAYETEGANCVRQKIGTEEVDVYEVVCAEGAGEFAVGEAE